MLSLFYEINLDALLVNQFASSADPVRVTQAINELCDELEERVKAGVESE